MVDIDQELVMLCRQYLPEWSGGIEDPRLKINFQDAGIFMENNRDKYDLIVWDLVDPHRWDNQEKTAASCLYNKTFFELLKESLTDQGILSMEYAFRNRSSTGRLLQGWNRVARRNLYIRSFEEKWIFSLYNNDQG